MATEIAIVMAVKNQRCQPPAPARKLNAAPALCIRTRLKNGVTSSTSPGAKAPLTQALVARSAMTIARLTTSHRIQRAPPASGMLARLARPFEVRHAPRADRRVLRVRTNVGAVVPAALAFFVGTRGHGDVDETARPPPVDWETNLLESCLRGYEYVLEIWSKRVEQFPIVATNLDRYVSLKR